MIGFVSATLNKKVGIAILLGGVVYADSGSETMAGVTKPGLYKLGPTTFSDSPLSGEYYGIFGVFGSGNLFTFQFIITDKILFRRLGGSGSWGTWKTIQPE